MFLSNATSTFDFILRITTNSLERTDEILFFIWFSRTQYFVDFEFEPV